MNNDLSRRSVEVSAWRARSSSIKSSASAASTSLSRATAFSAWRARCWFAFIDIVRASALHRKVDATHGVDLDHFDSHGVSNFYDVIHGRNALWCEFADMDEPFLLWEYFHESAEVHNACYFSGEDFSSLNNSNDILNPFNRSLHSLRFL